MSVVLCTCLRTRARRWRNLVCLATSPLLFQVPRLSLWWMPRLPSQHRPTFPFLRRISRRRSARLNSVRRPARYRPLPSTREGRKAPLLVMEGFWAAMAGNRARNPQSPGALLEAPLAQDRVVRELAEYVAQAQPWLTTVAADALGARAIGLACTDKGKTSRPTERDRSLQPSLLPPPWRPAGLLRDLQGRDRRDRPSCSYPSAGPYPERRGARAHLTSVVLDIITRLGVAAHLPRPLLVPVLEGFPWLSHPVAPIARPANNGNGSGARLPRLWRTDLRAPARRAWMSPRQRWGCRRRTPWQPRRWSRRPRQC